MDPASLWDALCRRPASTPDSAKPHGLAPLPLRPQPRICCLASKPRQVSLIPEALRRAIRRVVAAESPWPLVVLGPAGTGKSCAALCLLDHAGGFYYTAADLAAELIRAMQGRLATASGRSVWPEQLWSELASAALVVLDELGTRARVSDHAYECVKRLLDEREGRPLVCLGNLSLEQLSQVYDDRVCSRLAAGTLLWLDGDDRRLAHATKPPPAGGREG